MIELHHEVHGDARTGTAPLLLIHGGGSTIESNWAALLPTLTPTRQVVAVELQGHGRTPSPRPRASFETSADDVGALLRRLDLGPVDVLGFSNGGNVAMRLAMRHPQLVRRQIVASAFFQREGMIDGFWAGLAAADVTTMPAAALAADRAINPDPAHQQRLFELDSRQMLDFVDWAPEELTAMTVPTLFVAGDQDVIRVEHTVRMAGLVPQARLLILPANHGDYLGDALAPCDGPAAMHATLPWLLGFLDAAQPA